MARVLGIGGVFFKSSDPQALQSWYQTHLGIEPAGDGYVVFPWRDMQNPEQTHATVWSPFPGDTTYFDPTTAPYMVNYIVDDLRGMLQQLRDAGVQVDDRVEELDFGLFGWGVDPEGVRFELCQPITAGSEESS